MTQPTSVPVRRRRRPLLAVGAGLLLAVGAVAGATAVFSARTQTLAEDWTGKLASARASGAVQVQQTGYVRGLTSSTQTMTVTLDPKNAAEAVRLLVTNHIQHGPFPGFSGVGQATIDTDFRFENPGIQAGFEKAFAGKKPQIRTVIGLGGASTTQVDVPQGQFAEGGDSVTWQALGGQVRVAGLQTSTDLTWPGLSFKTSDGADGAVKGLSLKGETRREGENDLLGVGDSTLRIDQLSFGGAGQQGRVGGLEVSAQSLASAGQPGFSDALLKYSVADVQLAGQRLSKLQLHLSARHLARGLLSRLGQVLNEAQKESQNKGSVAAQTADEPFTAAQRKALEDSALELLRAQPVFRIDRLSVGEAGQDVVLTGQASLPGTARLSAEDLSAFGAQPQQALGDLDLRASVKGSERAVRALVARFGGPLAGLEDSLQSLVDAGYVKRSGDQLSVEVVSRAGRTTLNGQALGDF